MNKTESALNPNRVNSIFTECLFKEGEDEGESITVAGFANDTIFSKSRVDEHKDTIIDMLADLPDHFKVSAGDRIGASVMGVGFDKHGHEWTVLYVYKERLTQLGVAVGKVSYIVPKKDWPLLKNGMPFILINL